MRLAYYGSGSRGKACAKFPRSHRQQALETLAYDFLAADADRPLCPVCGMDVDPSGGLKSVYQGHTYYFCVPAHKQLFDSTPKPFVDAG